MKYYDSLDGYESWEEHYNLLIDKLGNNKKLIEAIGIVRLYHDTPRYLYKGNYKNHPLRVARILSEECGVYDLDIIIIALLHDIIERSEYKLEDIKSIFGDKIYSSVLLLSNKSGDDWEDFVKNIERSGEKNLILIKIVDKLDNNRGLVFSTNQEEIQKSIHKTEEIIIPLATKYFPEILKELQKSIISLKNKLG